jgi:Lon protease-like protein
MSQPLVLTSLPLFPLASLLFPGGVVALRVFEVRYLDMVRKCHLAGAPFGVVSLRSGQEVRRAGAPLEQLHEVGTLATIEQLRSPQPGLVTLECRGGQRFRIVRSHLLPHGLWVADVELLAPDQHVPIPQHLAATARSLAQVLASLRERTPSSPVAITPTPAQLGDCGWVANRWCELLPVPQELKQQLMQLDTPLVRLELVGDVLERTGIAPQ